MNRMTARQLGLRGLLAAVLVLMVVLSPERARAITDLNVDTTLSNSPYLIPPNPSIFANENVGTAAGGEIDQSSSTNTATGTLTLGVPAAVMGTYNLTGGSLSVGGNEYSGNSGSGTFTNSGGTDTVTDNLSLGHSAGGSGTYTLSAGSLAVGGGEYIGDSGSGIFTQSGGSDTVSGTLYVGKGSSSRGTYTLSGTGSLAVGGDGYVGYSGTGVFSQMGGSNTISGDLYLGNNSAASGSYSLSAGLLNATDEYVGSFGSGSFTQSGGSNTMTGSLYLGFASSNNSYTLSNGGSGSSLAVAGTEYVGFEGNGAFTQSGGANVVSTDLNLGYSSGASGAYNLSGGSLAVNGSEYIGFAGSGLFTQSGGAHAVANNLILGDTDGSGDYGSGTYNLSGGSLAVSGALNLAGVSGASGTFNLSGTGSLAAGTVNLNAGGTFSQTGGALNATIFNQQGGSVTAASSLENLGTFNYSSGAFAGRLLNYGSVNFNADFTAGNGLANYSAIPLDINAGRTVTLNGAGLDNQGTLVVNGNLVGGGPLLNDTTGTLSGTGTIQGNLTNQGTLSPGNSPGTLTVAGNYAQTASGTLVEQIASASSFSKLVVTGAASLNGALNIELLGGYIPSYGQGFSGILTAAGGVSGSFTTIINQYITPTLYWNVLYGAASVNLQANQVMVVARNFTNPSLDLTKNQYQVGNLLNSVAGVTTGDLGTVLNAIDSLTSNGAVANAYQQISPDKAAALPTLAFAGANLQKSALSRRITDLRFGPEDASLSAGGFGSSLLSYAHGEGLMVASSASSLTGLLTGQKEPNALEKPWGVYFDPGLILGNQASAADQTGFAFTMAGFTAGADYRVWQDLLLGVNTGYTYTSAGFRGSGGYVQGNTWPLNAYAAYLPKPFYAYGSLGYALNLYNLERDINFGGLSRAATSSPTGNQLNGYAETGYDLRVNPVVLTPAVSLSYSKLWLDGFTESGAGALNLTVGPQNPQSLQTGVGGKIAAPMRRDWVTVTPQAYAFYQHEYSDSSQTLDARLSQAGSAFTYLTGPPHRNFAVLGADVTIATKNNLKVQLDYNAEVGRGNYTAHYVSAGVRWQF